MANDIFKNAPVYDPFEYLSKWTKLRIRMQVFIMVRIIKIIERLKKND
jgi:hypothetical protein